MLKGFQKKYLKKLAHNLEPVLRIGQHGLTDKLLLVIRDELEAHELIKIKFIDFKEHKKDFSKTIVYDCECELVDIIGHVAIFYKEAFEAENKKIELPSR